MSQVDVVRTILANSPARFHETLVQTALIESSLNPTAVGDHGRSHGIFQEYDLGRGAGISIAGRRDVAAATRRAVREFSVFWGRGARGVAACDRRERRVPASESPGPR